MSSSRDWGWDEIAVTTSAVSLANGVGAGVAAAIRGDSIVESASISAVGTGLLTLGFGLFSKPNPNSPESTTQQKMIGFGVLQLGGTAIGYAGTKLFLNAATSTAPILNAALGYPVSAGLFFCAGMVVQYLEAERKTSDLSPNTHAMKKKF